MQVIPAIDIIGSKAVRLRQGDYNSVSIYDDNPINLVKRYVDYGLTRIHVVDLDGAKSDKSVHLSLLENMSAVSYAKIEWSGGIKDEISIREAFDSGASYVCIGTLAVKNPDIFKKSLKEYGSDKIILSADIKNNKVYVKGWTEASKIQIDEIIDRFLDYSLKQIIVTDIQKDGMLEGPSFDLYKNLQKKYPDIIFTVSGGVSSVEDIINLQSLGLKRVIVGKAIYENLISLKELQKINNHEI